MEVVQISPGCASRAFGDGGRRGYGAPGSSTGLESVTYHNRVRSGGGRRDRHGDPAGRSDGDQGQKEEERRGDLASQEVPEVPQTVVSPTQPRSLRQGVGSSPAGGRFWLLAGEDSDEEAGYSSDSAGTLPDPSKYLLSPVKIRPGMRAVKSKNSGKHALPDEDERNNIRLNGGKT